MSSGNELLGVNEMKIWSEEKKHLIFVSSGIFFPFLQFASQI